MHVLAFSVIFIALLDAQSPKVFCGTMPESSPCNPSNDRIDLTTHKFSSDCDERTFCGPTSSNSTNSRRDTNTTATGNSTSGSPNSTLSGTCTKRLCRVDEFPFGYDAGEQLPPLCKQGFFCPDRGDGCQSLQSVGSPCDMDRDYQCATGKRWESLSSDLNSNGSICLQSTCM